MTIATVGRRMGAVMLCAALALAGCSSKEEHSLVGKWQRGNDLIVTFTSDGKMIKQEGVNTDEMAYTVQDGVLYLKVKDLPMSLPFTVTFPSDDELVLTPQPARGSTTPPANFETEHLTRMRE